jgi:hypothetical protein
MSMERDERDFAISIPYAGHLVYTSLVGCLDGNDQMFSEVLKLLYGVVPFLCIHAPEASDYYIYPLLRIDGGERVIGLSMYIGIAFAAAGGSPVWRVVQNIIGLPRINFIGGCLAHAGIKSEERDILAWMMVHTRTWVRRVVFKEVARHLGEMDEGMRRWCIIACGEIGMRDGDEEVKMISRGVVDESLWKEGDVFQAVGGCEGKGVRGGLRGMYHRDEGVRRHSLAVLSGEVGEEGWGQVDGDWNALVFSVVFLTARLNFVNVGTGGEDTRTLANEVERLVTLLSGKLVLVEPQSVLNDVLRVISGIVGI